MKPKRNLPRIRSLAKKIGKITHELKQSKGEFRYELEHTHRTGLKGVINYKTKNGFLSGTSAINDKEKEVSAFKFFEYPIGHAFRTCLAIRNVLTSPTYAREEIAYRALLAFITFARQNPQVQDLELRVRPRNSHAIKLYRKLGFKPYERHLIEDEKRAYIVMRLALGR